MILGMPFKFLTSTGATKRDDIKLRLNILSCTLAKGEEYQLVLSSQVYHQGGRVSLKEML